jgi:hypothetical protein
LITLWRGICKEHHSYKTAKQGKAKPRGGHNDPQKHNLGDTKSIFTSWARNPEIAKLYAKNSGVILEKDFPTPLNQLVFSDDLFYEDEVLVVRIVNGAKVCLIEKESLEKSIDL